VTEDVLLGWIADMYPSGSPSLYGGWKNLVLVYFDEVSPGLAFNSQGAKYAKWVFNHVSDLIWHSDKVIIDKIKALLKEHPELEKCVKKREKGRRHASTIEFAWFNVYCVPGWGERFKCNEQVLHHY